ncbi:hypothetical protein, partial [Endothiovibrio diazotrophicus]
MGTTNLYVRRLGYSLLEPGEEGPAELDEQCGVNLKSEALAGRRSGCARRWGRSATSCEGA